MIDYHSKKASPILLSHWIGRFGNRMHQYAYGSTYSELNEVDFILPSEWEGSYLFKGKRHKILDHDDLRLELNQSHGTQNSRENALRKYLPEARKINPEKYPENYKKHFDPVYFDSVCAYGNDIYKLMSKSFLLDLFEFSDLVKQTESYKYWESKKGTYDIAHLRRDDIANAQYNKTHTQGYSVISENSYHKAFEKFGFDKGKMEWVSDDHMRKWHKDRPISQRLSWVYPIGSEYRKDIVFDWLEDFLKLYFARTVFRANSSFSWWASFLSPTAKVYSPVLDKQSIYGVNDRFEEIDVDFVEGNSPHWMYSPQGIKSIYIEDRVHSGKTKFFPNSNNQADQEAFVLNILGEKRKGHYVEVGGHHSKIISNTYLLESEYAWKGVSFEIERNRSAEYNENRINPCLNVDAISFNYKEYFEKNNFPKQIDYLQLDIEPAENTLKCLKSLPLNEYRFSVITFEHDLYVDKVKNHAVQMEAQNILKNLGYILVVENVLAGDLPFEDWWIDPLSVPSGSYSRFMSKNIKSSEIISLGEK